MYTNYIIIVKPGGRASLNFNPSKTASYLREAIYVKRRNFI